METIKIIEVIVLFCSLEFIFVILHEISHYTVGKIAGTKGKIEFRVAEFLGAPVFRGRYVPEKELQGTTRRAVAIAPLVLLPVVLWITLTLQNTEITKWVALPAVAASIPSSGDLLNYFKNEEGYVPRRAVPFLNNWDLLRAAVSFFVVALI